ncbi:regulator of hemoglobinization and erythroid cell expansion protein [Grus japonensis]|uniref:Regulator of hemoglobinization and erythroid cell expansion protein n=1 Tax=Grus japonensis TaxID=30415 RepID=A0ABC9XRK6_GRUJA
MAESMSMAEAAVFSKSSANSLHFPMPRWMFVATAAVTLILYALLLLTLYIMLSRKIGSSDTSSETSDDSDSNPSCPQDPRSEENLNYTSLVFPGKSCGPGSTGDYENMKTGADYVNVDPKKRKADFWLCSSPVASKSIEYTEVKL